MNRSNLAAEATSHYQELCQQVDAVADRRRRVRCGTGACRLLAAVLGPLLLALLLDRGMPLPGLIRAAVLLLCAVLGAALLARGVLLPWLRRPSRVAGAQFLERQLPALETCLISALQIYQDLFREPPWFDRQMVEATLRGAVLRVRGQDLRSLVDLRPLKRSAALAGLLLSALLVYAAWDAAGLRAQWGRFLGAFADLRQELAAASGREIRVEVLPDGKTTVLRGSRVTLRATLSGFQAPQVSLRLTPEGGEAEEYVLETRGAASIDYTLAEALVSVTAVFSAQQVSSEPLALRVVERPRVVNIQLECLYPAYVRRPPLRLPRSSGEISALRGSHLVLTIEANQELRGGHLEVLRGTPVPLAVGGRFARAVLGIEEDLEYRIHLVGADGFGNEAPLSRQVRALPDLAPEIQFANLGIDPHGEIQLKESVAAVKALEVAARDDYGLRKILLHYDVEAVVKELYHEPIRDQQKTRVFAIPRQSWNGVLARVGELGLRVGDRLSFWAEALDWYDREADAAEHAARTPVYHLVVVGEEFAWEDLEYRPDETLDFGLYDALKRKSRARQKPPRESLVREPRLEMPGIEPDLPYGHDDVPLQYQSAWKAYTSSLME